MTEKLIICPRCSSNACSQVTEDKTSIWVCFGCGFTSNSSLDKTYAEIYKQNLPELYKDLEFIDENGLHWYPLSIVLEDKSMVFADGTSIEDWKWASAQSKITEGVQTTDMSTLKKFEESDFMDALEHVGYFKKKE